MLHGFQSQSKCAFVCGQINDPPGARSRVVYTGLTVAEGFRDEGRKVLLFVDNHFRFTQVLQLIYDNFSSYIN